MNILKAITGAVETGVGVATGMPFLAASGASTFLGGLTQPNASTQSNADVVSSLIGDRGANGASVNALGSLAGQLAESPDAGSFVTQLALA
jgi:hypothetical protein